MLFTFPVSNETKNLFEVKKSEVSLAEVTKEIKASKCEEMPQKTSLFDKKSL